MTKKDYIAIAGVISETIKPIKNNYIQLETVKSLAIDLAVKFKADNDRFDYFRFIEACGIEK